MSELRTFTPLFARLAEAPSKLEELAENLVYLAQVFPLKKLCQVFLSQRCLLFYMAVLSLSLLAE
jgi:hypothetical protein